MTSDLPIIRNAVRVLLLDECNRVLLLKVVNSETDESFWCPPGGGIEEGETVQDAAQRELFEELGLQDVSVSNEIWHRRHVFRWRGEAFDQRERWFMERVDHFTPNRDANTALELFDISAWRWWSTGDLSTSVDEFVPRNLADLLEDLITNGPPLTPISVGV